MPMSCMSANEFVLLGLDEGRCNDLSVKELGQLVEGQDKDEENVFVKETPSVKESDPAAHEESNIEDRTDVSPDAVLQAQLTLAQYWTKNNFDLSPAVIQVLERTRTQLLQQQHAVSSTTSMPS
ncbi:hypothetical protein PC129_g1751 [Phytophthora cactorum]|uniref:Uncharacterized protein n=1 Tax=Phytophthora cactorum TaxID=29920 RepID=A0A8T1DHV5_9STRA|nr:hypothetical protein Pcac1_g20201 [Phytophthora cactorum]KAG2876190.1 hypothetical protein PC114_g24332 [Phytophthora cactorum]KAG2938622.1 hypothetical protein PC115_g3684 [Phytophthora cactorum]KAG2991359.1 hypothetical protein PC118_g5124 [Phytophthora cactorum]KAG3008850.1 hypothetical protein PC120_g15968 [Phytophthora cactorum]